MEKLLTDERDGEHVINAGGAIHLIGKEVLGWGDDEVTEHLDKIGTTLDLVFARARATSRSTEATARRLARERIASLD